MFALRLPASSVSSARLGGPGVARKPNGAVIGKQCTGMRVRVSAEDNDVDVVTKAESSESSAPAQPQQSKPLPDGIEKIYVGKGRYLEDDPSKYPGRDNLYTGGFAGGETGLKNFVAEKGIPYSSPAKESKAAKASAKKPAKGVYVGKGKFFEDDKSNTYKVMKLSTRDALVGGFAGGEVGLKEFVATGEVPFGEGRKQQSPLIVAGIVSLLGVAGGILFTDVGEFGEQVISGKTNVSPEALSGLDENTKFLLEAGVLLTGVVASLIGGRALIGSFKKSLAEGVTKAGVLAVFWIMVFVAAQFVLDSP